MSFRERARQTPVIFLARARRTIVAVRTAQVVAAATAQTNTD